MTNRDKAIRLLADTCRKVISNQDLYPNDICKIAYKYFFKGCKSNEEYKYLVNFLIDDIDMREELLKWKIMNLK